MPSSFKAHKVTKDQQWNLEKHGHGVLSIYMGQGSWNCQEYNLIILSQGFPGSCKESVTQGGDRFNPWSRMIPMLSPQATTMEPVLLEPSEPAAIETAQTCPCSLQEGSHRNERPACQLERRPCSLTTERKARQQREDPHSQNKSLNNILSTKVLWYFLLVLITCSQAPSVQNSHHKLRFRIAFSVPGGVRNFTLPHSPPQGQHCHQPSHTSMVLWSLLSQGGFCKFPAHSRGCCDIELSSPGPELLTVSLCWWRKFF